MHRRPSRPLGSLLLCAALVAPALSACSSEGGAAGVGDVPCGPKTCSATEYCEIQCTCCGVPTFDGGPQPSASYTCKPIPAGCSGARFCDCDSAVRSHQCEPSRTVSIPCA